MEVDNAEPRCSSLALSRFLCTCGHIALYELLHLDISIFGELKRRRAVCEANKAGTGKASKSGRGSNVSVAASASRMHKVCKSLCYVLLYRYVHMYIWLIGQVLGDIAAKQFHLLVLILPFHGLSVCHVRTLCAISRRYRHDFFCIRQPHVSPSQTVLKSGLHQSHPSSPNFA